MMFQLVCLLFCFLFSPLHSLIQQSCQLRHRHTSTRSLEPGTIISDVDLKNITSLLILVSYDGGRFKGWSANLGENQTGFVRSVEGVLRRNLSKLFGGVDNKRIVVEGCSRTDKGVHATGMVAQVYCLAEDWEVVESPPSIPGKRLPHPESSVDDRCFVPFRMSPWKLVDVLNRMLPDDVSVRAVCPSPFLEKRAFHPTLDADKKTYQYFFSVGPIHDPSKWRRTWHVGSEFESSALDEVCSMLRGTHNFEAFRGAPRGKGDRQKQMHQNTLCTLFDVSLEIETTSFPFPDLTTYRVSVTGDRFLYKMVRFLVGSLVAVGMGTLYPMEIDRALRTGSFDPGRKPQCAPGCGLVLVDVSYTPELEWQ